MNCIWKTSRENSLSADTQKAMWGSILLRGKGGGAKACALAPPERVGEPKPVHWLHPVVRGKEVVRRKWRVPDELEPLYKACFKRRAHQSAGSPSTSRHSPESSSSGSAVRSLNTLGAVAKSRRKMVLVSDHLIYRLCLNPAKWSTKACQNSTLMTFNHAGKGIFSLFYSTAHDRAVHM
ncbi:hypothetical protein Y032_0013g2137 [Ancylostoma ceylanicum]|uniref:Uncharacterized protein n=1 Tax=Ancylostoma ceylanicum TaxID=53326 RepID=A0A016VDM7_9BILA|nr:hypothetical protein Y032_0013g2137 [Ancylostoma ceylanicum]